ncbi:MAG: RDD family protein [Firmicutes bacterium]|nr:RDD family protein [Bacillota bacterium]
MNNIKLKRVGAYLIDLLIISFLAVLVSQIKSLNPHQEKYEKVINEYQEYYEANFGNVTNIESSDLLNDEYADYMYKINYYSITNSLMEVAIIVLYFTFFPHFNNSQTVGKRMFKIKLESLDDKKVTLWKHFCRSFFTPICANIIFYNVITTLLNVGSLFIFKKLMYLNANLAITYIINIFCYADILAILIRKDHRSIRDLIFKTRVVEIC